MLTPWPAIFCAILFIASVATLLFAIRIVTQARNASRASQQRFEEAQRNLAKIESDRAAACAKLDATLDAQLQRRKAERLGRRQSA